MEWLPTIDRINKSYRIILGSQSPRRKYLLSEIGLKFNTEVKNTNESFPDSLKGAVIPEFLCAKKADAFTADLTENTLVITADTIVWINDRVLNKPADEQEALDMLKILSGNTHEVFTGVCVLSNNKKDVFSGRSCVTFKRLSDHELQNYINQYSPFDKAGSYGAQECLPVHAKPCSSDEVTMLKALNKEYMNAPNLNITTTFKYPFQLIEKIEGSYFNVMGLPLVETINRLNLLI